MIYPFTVTIARQETSVYEYSVQAATEEEAKTLAYQLHYKNPDSGVIVSSNEWTQEVDCEDENFYFEEQ